MNKKLFILISLAIIITLTGCTATKVIPHITSSIDQYAVIMSSVPGFPIDVTLDIRGNEPDDIVIELETENGDFLEWGSDMKVRHIGKRIEYTGETVYWSPFTGENSFAGDTIINVKVIYTGALGKVIVRNNRKIYLSEGGRYSFDEDR